MWKYELYEDVDGAWGWHLRGEGGEIAMTSGGTYGSRTLARRALVQARAHAGDAKLPGADGIADLLGEVLERIAKRDEEEQTRRTSIAVLN